MLLRIPASVVNERYAALAAQLLAPIRGRKSLDASRVDWAFEYGPSPTAGCLANMLGRQTASERYHSLSEDDQVRDFERNCIVYLSARDGRCFRWSQALAEIPPEVLEAHRWHVRLETEWRSKTGRRTGTQAAAR